MTAVQEYDVEDSILPLQPSLNYTAPELVRSTMSSAGWSSDIFSFGCLAYHLIVRKPLFDCHNNVKMVYTNPFVYLFPKLVVESEIDKLDIRIRNLNQHNFVERGLLWPRLNLYFI